MKTLDLFTIGYGRWLAKDRWPKLIASLKAAGIELLCDIRHSPCSSNLDPSHHYGPRAWHLDAGGKGIAAGLAEAGIEYRWLVELGNPQKKDPQMAVLLEHLADPQQRWPVHRGLAILKHLVQEKGRRCCLICACKEYDDCHRKAVAEAFVSFVTDANVKLRDLSS